ncbi:MAG: aminopeptidase, partial [Deinococcales bacterium]
QWRADGSLAMIEEGFAALSILAGDPDLLAGTDPQRWATFVRVWQQANRPVQAIHMSNGAAWCVAAYPGLAWARKVTPGVPDEQAVTRLWEAIFAATRVDLPDAVAAWKEHSSHLHAAAARLNERRYAALRFRGSGTDLRVGLAEGHVWEGGAAQTRDGVVFVPNMPTEEVFTAPHRDRIDGVVRASMPLASGGTVVDDFELRFEGGRVVEAHAGRGQHELERILDTDEGARSLGEVALVPASSPIAKGGLLFFQTLFDENAASHVALGRAYPMSVAGGSEMSEAEAAAAGLNDSLTHVDFMIGSAEMDVDGERQDGGVEAVMRAGEWVD